MTIKTKLSLLFTALSGTLLLLFAGTLYYFAEHSREQEFYALLKKEAITKANLLLQAKVDAQTLQQIYRTNRQVLYEVETAIYDTLHRLLYHDALDIDIVKETPEMLQRIQQQGLITFYQQKWQVIGMRYSIGNNSYLVTATAYDEYGYTKLEQLLKAIILLALIALVAVYFIGRFFAKRALQPVKIITEKAKSISATNLDLRLPESNNRDELTILAQTFNDMLNRLEQSFDAQKQFVSNISHELRTPLAAIITELELAAQNKRSAASYHTTIENVLGDARKLNKLFNSLLDLAKASYDRSEISFKNLRVDELLLDAKQQVQKANPHYTIHLNYRQVPEEESYLTVHGNAYLLQVAFANLFENGCKFSENKTCTALLSSNNSIVQISFEDNGPGINEADISKLFTPFYRGSNKHTAPGSGIGLSLTHKIIQLHKGNISYEPARQGGSRFCVTLLTSTF